MTKGVRVRYIVLGAATGYFLMLLVVSISSAGNGFGPFTTTQAMTFSNIKGTDWRLFVPVLVGILVGLAFSSQTRKS